MCEKTFFKKKDAKELSSKLIELQRGCSVRLLSVDDCAKYLDEVECWLRIAKKSITGTKVIVHSDMSKLPNCYKYQADSTKAVFVYDGKHWCFLTAYRDRLVQRDARSYYHCEIELSDTAKEAILKRYEIR